MLESMATGVPLVTTRAGQAPDLVVDGENGNMVEPDDPVGLAAGTCGPSSATRAARRRFRDAGRRVAEENSYARSAALARLLEGFVGAPGRDG